MSTTPSSTNLRTKMSALRCSTPCTSCIRRAFRKEVCRALLSRRPRCYNHATPTSIWYHPSNIQSSHPIDRKVRCPIPILKGLYPSARGCSRRATPGGRRIGASTLKGGQGRPSPGGLGVGRLFRRWSPRSRGSPLPGGGVELALGRSDSDSRLIAANFFDWAR